MAPVRGMAFAVVLGGLAPALADMAPLPPTTEPKSQPAPAKPAPCLVKTETLHGPRGPYEQVTGLVYSVATRVLNVTPPEERHAAVKWFGIAPQTLKQCYRWPAASLALAPTVSEARVSALFSATGTLLSVAVVSSEPRLDKDCVKAVLSKKEALARSGKLVLQATFELSFSTTCPTVTCPAGRSSGGLAYGRAHELCQSFQAR